MVPELYRWSSREIDIKVNKTDRPWLLLETDVRAKDQSLDLTVLPTLNLLS